MSRLQISEDLKALLPGESVPSTSKHRSLCYILALGLLTTFILIVVIAMMVMVVLCWQALNGLSNITPSYNVTQDQQKQDEHISDDMRQVKISLENIAKILEGMKHDEALKTSSLPTTSSIHSFTSPPSLTTKSSDSPQPTTKSSDFQPFTTANSHSNSSTISRSSVAKNNDLNLWLVLQNMTDLSTFVDGLKKANLGDLLTHEGDFAVFAPTNDAFKSIPPYLLPIEDEDQLMEYHIVRGDVYRSNFTEKWNEHMMKTLLGKRHVRFNVYDNPSGQAFTANGCPITDFDHKAFNGEVHKISAVMASIYASKHGNLLTELAKHGSGRFNSFSRYLNTTKVATNLKTQGPYTLFAPTDVAFSALPKTILQQMNSNLSFAKSVLDFHLVNGTWYSSGIYNNLFLHTWQGNSLSFTVTGGNIQVNGKSGAHVTEKDRNANNGAWHVIDQVLLPPSYRPSLQ